jgi:medium-chain acyl-[acyl-carrier-protein] hydrolase
MNQHVNNIRYLQWVMESIPESVIANCSLQSIEGRFIAEAQYGDTIGSYTEQGNDPNSFVHAIKVKEGDKVCAIATSVWKKRDP